MSEFGKPSLDTPDASEFILHEVLDLEPGEYQTASLSALRILDIAGMVTERGLLYDDLFQKYTPGTRTETSRIPLSALGQKGSVTVRQIQFFDTFGVTEESVQRPRPEIKVAFEVDNLTAGSHVMDITFIWNPLKSDPYFRIWQRKVGIGRLGFQRSLRPREKRPRDDTPAELVEILKAAEESIRQKNA